MKTIKQCIIYIICFLIMSGVTGCSSSGEAEETLEKIYQEGYEDAVKMNPSGSLEMVREMVSRFGEAGYAAVDSENQINMVENEQVIYFCNKAAAKEEAEVTILVISYSDSLIRYDLRTEEGKINVIREYFQYQDDYLEKKSTDSYSVNSWKYTEEGYFIFDGSWFSEENYALTLSEAEEHTALRVLPLDEKCRELNRKYIRPIGYGLNNMFILDWNEKDFGGLDFYDLFDIFYSKVNGQESPYTLDEDWSVGTIYQIPREDFEKVIMTYFNIDSDTLQSKVGFSVENGTYEYKPRTFYESEYPQIPYPEVIEYAENSDGTLTLTVNAVFPDENTSKACCHEVVVRPLNNGEVQYVSNHIISLENNDMPTWHVDRLTEEHWNELFPDVLVR